MNGIIEKIDESGIDISGKHYFLLPNVRQYLTNFKVGDTVEYSTSKNDKGAISFIKAGHVTGSQVPKEEAKSLKKAEDEAQKVIEKWNAEEARVKAMPQEEQVQWAVKILEDLHVVPDRIEKLAREIIQQKNAPQAAESSPPLAAGAGGAAPPLQTGTAAPKAAPVLIPPGAVTRDPREVRIVRQSCLKVAVETLAGLSLTDKGRIVKEVAADYEEWVWR